MGSFGERLQREREMRGITLEEIAEATKIGTRSLRALEEEQFDKLPGGIFNKGFVRAYSRYLGIDEEQAVADYVTAIGDAQPNLRAQPTDEEIVSAVVEKKLGKIDEDLRVPPMAWGVLAVLTLVLVGAVAGWRYVSQHGWPRLRQAEAGRARTRTRAVPRADAATPSTTAAAQVPPSPPASTSAAAAPPVSTKTEVKSTAPAPDGFLLRVHAKKETWVLLIVDGKQEMSGMLAADADKAVRAQRRVVFKTGDAGAIELFQDGKPLPLLGEDKQVRQVAITAQGMEQVKSKKVE